MEQPLTKNIRKGESSLNLKDYENAGGYEGFRKAMKMTPDEVLEAVKSSELKGRGGAGYKTGMKWGFVPRGENAPKEKYLVANADEMEPGTFKDRLLLEGDPHQLIEGMIISSYALQADHAFIFLRWEYKLAEKTLNAALHEAYQAGYLGKNILGSGYKLDMELHVSAGRYICGEETALLNSLEGKRAVPRAKPTW